MAHMEFKKRSIEWGPANYLNTEAGNKIFSISPGELVVGMAYRTVAVFGDAATINIGDDTTAHGFDALVAGELNGTEFALLDGAYLVNSVGKLYTGADTIDLDYVPGGSAADGTIRVYIITASLEP